MDSGVCFGVCTFYHVQNGLNEERLLSVIPEHMILCVVLFLLSRGTAWMVVFPQQIGYVSEEKTSLGIFTYIEGYSLQVFPIIPKIFQVMPNCSTLFQIICQIIPNYDKLFRIIPLVCVFAFLFEGLCKRKLPKFPAMVFRICSTPHSTCLSTHRLCCLRSRQAWMTKP